MWTDKQIEAWSAPLEEEANRIVIPNRIPRTLADAVGIKPKSVPATERNMDLTIAKLQDLAKQVEKDWHELSVYPEKFQGMAMSKIANIQNKLEQLIESLESDIDK